MVFESDADNLTIDADTLAAAEHVRDMKSEETRRITFSFVGCATSKGCTGPVISGNGRFVACISQSTNIDDDHTVILRGRKSGTFVPPMLDVTGQIETSHATVQHALSENGGFVAFGADAATIGADKDAQCDVFVHRLK